MPHNQVFQQKQSTPRKKNLRKAPMTHSKNGVAVIQRMGQSGLENLSHSDLLQLQSVIGNRTLQRAIEQRSANDAYSAQLRHKKPFRKRIHVNSQIVQRQNETSVVNGFEYESTSMVDNDDEEEALPKPSVFQDPTLLDDESRVYVDGPQLESALNSSTVSAFIDSHTAGQRHSFYEYLAYKGIEERKINEKGLEYLSADKNLSPKTTSLYNQLGPVLPPKFAHLFANYRKADQDLNTIREHRALALRHLYLKRNGVEAYRKRYWELNHDELYKRIFNRFKVNESKLSNHEIEFIVSHRVAAGHDTLRQLTPYLSSSTRLRIAYDKAVLTYRKGKLLESYNNAFDRISKFENTYTWATSSYDDSHTIGEDQSLLRQVYDGTADPELMSQITNLEDLKTRMESKKWSWMLKGRLSDVAENREAKIQYQNVLNAKNDNTRDYLQDAKEFGSSAREIGSYGFTVATGAKALETISTAVKQEGSASQVGQQMFEASRGMLEGAAGWILGQAFSGVMIGADLIKMFRYQRRRKKGYEAAMARAGIDKNGETSIKPSDKASTEKVRLGRVAYYAYNKTKRAFRTTLVKVILKAVRWIAHMITIITGGSSLLVSGSIALAADISRALMAFGQKAKGFWKSIRGRRGVNRKAHAMELLTLAKQGNEDALKTILEVNPFDGIQKVVKFMFHMHGIKLTRLPHPGTVRKFKQSLEDGYYADEDVQKKLVVAIANTMRSV